MKNLAHTFGRLVVLARHEHDRDTADEPLGMATARVGALVAGTWKNELKEATLELFCGHHHLELSANWIPTFPAMEPDLFGRDELDSGFAWSAGWPTPRSLARCRYCGCTQDRACPGGCYWTYDDACSSCAPPEVRYRCPSQISNEPVGRDPAPCRRSVGHDGIHEGFAGGREEIADGIPNLYSWFNPNIADLRAHSDAR